MKKALNKDIIRTIWKEKKRFISIMMITTLGVTVMTGLAAGCRDLRMSADRFFDEQELFDISVQSTLGLTDEDIDVLLSLDGVEKAEGAFSEIVHTKKGDANKTAEVKMLKTDGQNVPYVVEGVLPQNADEIVVTKNYIADTGKQIGDTVVIEEMMDEEEEEAEDSVNPAETSDDSDDSENEEISMEDLDIEIEEEVETPNFLNTSFTITGVVIDVMDINNANGSAGFRATPNADYTFFVTPDAVDSEVYTAVYLSLNGTDELLCYSEEYENRTAEVISVIEKEIKEQREQARYDAVTIEAYEKVSDAEEEMNDAFAEVEQEFADAEQEIADGWVELEDGKTELSEKEAEAAQEIADARKEIEDGYKEIEDAEKELAEASGEIASGEKELQAGIKELTSQEENARQQLADAQTELDNQTAANNTAKQQMAEQLSGIKMLLGTEWTDELQTAWEALVSAAQTVLLPVIQEQSAGGQTQTGSSEEQMQQLMVLLGQSPEYQTAQATFAGLFTTAVTNVGTQFTIQKTELETQLAGIDSQLTGLETQIQQLETDIQQLEAEIQQLETDKENAASDDEIAQIEEQIAQIEEQVASKTTELQTAVATKTELDATKVTLEDSIASIDAQLLNLPNLPQNAIQLAMGTAQTNAVSTVLATGQETLNSKKSEAEAQFKKAWEEINAGSAQIAQGRSQIADAYAEIEENRKKLDDAVIELNENELKAQNEIADAKVELADGETELLDGETELAENRVTYEEKKTEALDKIEEAKQEIADIDMTQWYVQDRTSLSGYVNVETDAACIESLATVFAVVFFVVAILISLTTVTRMVEEERGLIGTYKALGFTDKEIRKKYVSYALAASVFGGILGNLGGFVALPEVLFVFFDVMYMLPNYYLQVEMVSGTVSVLLFIIGIAGAAYVACYAELKHLPAHLMRPKSPKMGSRVFLEYIPFLWKRFSFLNKVTARNLFRYKKRFFMTVLGITGCTALLVFGFAIKDSVSELLPMQYEHVFKYDLLAATAATDNGKLISYMENSEEVDTYLNIQVETIKLKNKDGNTEKVQMMVFPDGSLLSEYLTVTDTELAPVSFQDEGVYLTENAAIILDVKKGDTVAIQKLNLEQENAKVAGIIKNYLGNSIYLTQTAYETIFETFEPNGVLANLKDSCENQIVFAERLAEEDWILSAISTEDLKEGFSAAFTLINIVVYVVLIFAAGLAFVVLFTLASVNISERIRELATIKVLGFFDGEVHAYVNKETLILTAMGILLGLPVGAAMSSSLTSILKMPSIYFEVTIYTKSYFFSAGLAMLFALLVQVMTDRTLNGIAPAEALKSVE